MNNKTETINIIELLGRNEENIIGYAATEEKYLFVDGLLMDNGIGRSDRNMDLLETMLENAKIRG